eukprot:COSAG05_NODE_1537_length_4608_cov_57.827456_5_plen_156_part_00
MVPTELPRPLGCSQFFQKKGCRFSCSWHHSRQICHRPLASSAAAVVSILVHHVVHHVVDHVQSQHNLLSLLCFQECISLFPAQRALKTKTEGLQDQMMEPPLLLPGLHIFVPALHPPLQLPPPPPPPPALSSASTVKPLKGQSLDTEKLYTDRQI